MDSIWVWLAFGAACNVVAGGRWSTAAAGWLAPIFLLHFLQEMSSAWGLAWVWLALFVTTFWAYRGLIPVPPVLGLAISAGIALGGLAPFAADYFLADANFGAVSTLIFPAAAVAVELLSARQGPYGSWGAVAYSQYGVLPFTQLASVTGTTGAAFLVNWCAAVIAWVWAHGTSAPGSSTVVAACAAVSVGVMMWGGLRLATARRPTSTVPVAAIGWPEGLVSQAEFMRALDPAAGDDVRAALHPSFGQVADYFIAATHRAAEAGARIIVWPEACAMTFAEGEATLLGRLRDVCAQRGVYVVGGLAVIHLGAKRPLENKAVLVAPDGHVALQYVKAIPVPGFETTLSRPGPRRIPTCDTPYGRLAIAICFDLDFPAYIRQAGLARADILLAPASDWEAITLAHHVSATFRAVENGVSLVRATRWGLSGAVDVFGRELAWLDPFRTPSATLFAHVPTRGARTIYARWGDWLGWSCVAALAALALSRLVPQ